uniref:[phosphatase 2A protein]-leucine-carboxy methyltransferase n=1 Tax=Chaetoceros debilis TaxID=122233 RepID=A0A7S3VC67_9STRA|mmetsp:Transcript_6169/g.9062  ORF Transcript_6169/g.9062 Transcript_6169/m.9062 type:complete len:630 (-) Transcript_6169:40-1929(-)
MSKINTPVAKTAIDAINAKLSALNCGYKPISDESEGNYYHKLLQAIKSTYTSSTNSTNKIQNPGIKRQTPLVNSGYAIRVATISSMIAKFIEKNTKSNTKQSTDTPGDDTGVETTRANIMLLGCGLDIVGIWGSSLAMNVDVYEIDCIDNCLVKQDALTRIGIIQCDHVESEHNDEDEDDGTTASADQDGGIILQGRIDYGAVEGCTISFNASNNTYSLLAADLRDTVSLEQIVASSSFNPFAPTIVISELVIAYLGQHTEKLLKYISSSLCICDESMFLAYEPVIPSSGKTVSQNSNVMAYAKDYFGQFSSKLNRGEADHGTQKNSSQMCFEPIGKSTRHVENKLRRCQFDGFVDCSQMSKAARYFEISRRSPPELFDEQIALQFHLHCYSIIIATSNKFNIRALNSICPWIVTNHAIRGIGYFSSREIKREGETMILTSIKKKYEEEVRNLFKDTYTSLFDDYPSVRKLVKSALKSDLSTKGQASSDRNDCQSDSVIWNRYSDNGGAFWVVIEVDEEKQHILGCIGVTKKCTNSVVNLGLEGSEYYEMNRLAVRQGARRKGIGKLLLGAVEEHIQRTTISRPTCMVATTPKVLEAANTLYSANGFTIHEEIMMGKMLIRTYKKMIPH